MSDCSQVVAALLKLWSGERNIKVLQGSLPQDGIGVQLLRHVLRMTTTEVARAVEEDNTKAQTSLRQHDHVLRIIARVACAPLEQAGMDQTKCLQACSDLEERGVRLFDATLAIFTGERDPSIVCRGLDRIDQALVRQILVYISQGSSQMIGPDWDDLDVDTILGGRGGSGSSFGSGSEGTSFGGSGMSSGGHRSEFWTVVESGPLVDRMGRSHNPTQLQLKAKTAIGVFFSGHWCPPSREFTPDLIDAYDAWAREKGFEIIFCSSDHSEEEFHDYREAAPLFPLPHNATSQLMLCCRAVLSVLLPRLWEMPMVMIRSLQP